MSIDSNKTVKNDLLGDSVEIKERSIQNFLNTEVKDFAKYVIETRAMPNIMDGLRVGARKILWASITGDLSKKKLIKMPSLIGDTMKLHYNHGDAALMNTIVQLCSTHIYKYAPLEVIGQIGTLRVPKCDTAPRYLHIRKSPFIKFFEVDKELFELQHDDGEQVEPKFFLPIIPITLLWRTNSPGFGFSFRSFSYSIDSIIDNCILSITKGSCNATADTIPLIPTISGIKEENVIYNGNKEAWYTVGEYSMNYDTDTLIITDLPHDVTFEKFDAHLAELQESGYILKFIDTGIDGKIRYIVQFARGRLKLLSNDKWKFFQKMKLFSKIWKDTLNVIDEDGKTMLFYDTPYELIDGFIKRRMVFYAKRKTKTIQVLKEKINVLSNKIKFIYLVINDELIINKRKSADIKADLDKHNLPHDVLKMNIDKLSSDEIAKMEEEIVGLKDYLNYIENTTIQEMYVRDLIELKSQISEIKKPV